MPGVEWDGEIATHPRHGPRGLVQGQREQHHVRRPGAGPDLSRPPRARPSWCTRFPRGTEHGLGRHAEPRRPRTTRVRLVDHRDQVRDLGRTGSLHGAAACVACRVPRRPAQPPADLRQAGGPHVAPRMTPAKPATRPSTRTENRHRPESAASDRLPLDQAHVVRVVPALAVADERMTSSSSNSAVQSAASSSRSAPELARGARHPTRSGPGSPRPAAPGACSGIQCVTPGSSTNR